MGKEKPKVIEPAGEGYDKIYAKGRAAVQNFAETLEVSFEGITINQKIKLLEAKMADKLKDKSFQELLLTGDEGAVAGLLSTVWNAAIPNLVGRQAVQVITGTTPSIRVPKAAKATAYKVGRTGGAPISAEAYSYVEAVARLWECIPVVPRTLIEDATWSVIERQYAEGARAIADAETGEICVGYIADQTGGTETTSEAITWTVFFIMATLCMFFVTTCANNVNELNSKEEICYKLLEAKQDGKGVCDKRPTYWTHGHPREVEDRVLQSE